MAFKDRAVTFVIRVKDLGNRAWKRYKDDLVETDEAAKKASSGSGGLAQLARRATAAVGAFFGFRAVVQNIKQVLTTGDQFERLALQLRAVTGSIAAGEEATQWIREFTKDTPLQLQQVTDAFITLKNFGLDPQNGTLQSIVDQNEKLGGGFERLIGITRALGQAQAKQKLQGEEILQLIERGVPVWDLLADATGRSVAELNEMSSAGALGTDVIQQLIRVMGEQSTGAAAANMTTLTGIVSNLKDVWQEFLNQVAESGVLDDVRVRLQGLQAAVKQLGEDGSLQRWAQGASDAIVGLVSGIQRIATALISNRGAIILFAQAWAAAKVIETTSSLFRMGKALGTDVTGGARSAAIAVRSFGAGLLAVGVVNFVQQTRDLVSGLIDVVRAERELREAREDGLGVAERTNEYIQDYATQTGLAAQSLDDIKQAVEAGIAIRDRDNGIWIAGSAAVERYKESLKDTKTQIEDTAGALDGAFNAAVTQAVADFDALIAKGGSARETLAKVFGKYDLQATQDVAQLLGLLQELEATGRATGQAIEESLTAALQNLTANQLQAFVINTRLAFEQGRIDAQSFADTIDGAVSGALQRLNVDLDLIETGISAVGRQAIDTFKLVADQIDSSGDSADIQSKKIAAAYVSAFAEIETAAGQTELTDALRQAFDSGAISARDYADAIDRVKDSVSGAKPEVERLRNEVETLQERLKDAGNQSEQTGQQVAEAGTSGGAAFEIMTQAIAGYTAQMEELGDRAVNLWERTVTGARGATEAIDPLVARLGEVNSRLRELSFEGGRVFDATGLRGKLIEMATAARQVEKQFLEQKIELQSLNEEYTNGRISAEQFIRSSERMLQTANLLDDQDLSGLRAGIEAARASMESLRDSTLSTLESLQNELDRLQGNTAAIQQRQFDQRIRGLEAALEQAQRTGDAESIANAQESLRLAREIFAVQQQANQENNSQANQANNTRRVGSTNFVTADESAENAAEIARVRAESNRSTQPTTIIELRGPSGSTATVSSDNPDQLLQVLEEAGQRTT